VCVMCVSCVCVCRVCVCGSCVLCLGECVCKCLCVFVMCVGVCVLSVCVCVCVFIAHCVLLIPVTMLQELESKFPSAGRGVLLGYLKHRDWNSEEAGAQYEGTLEWQKTLPPRTINNFSPYMLYPPGCDGPDGCVVCLEVLMCSQIQLAEIYLFVYQNSLLNLI
jgi:hypothetical protein